MMARSGPEELKTFLQKVAKQLNKKLQATGSNALVVPGENQAWVINYLTERGLYVLSYSFSPGHSWYKPEGEHNLFMQMPPRSSYVSYPRTDASQTDLVAARDLASQVLIFFEENEGLPLPTMGAQDDEDHEEPEREEHFSSDDADNTEIDYGNYESDDFENYEVSDVAAERKMREEAESSATTWRTLGGILITILVIIVLVRCGGPSFPEDCEYIQDPRGGYTECF